MKILLAVDEAEDEPMLYGVSWIQFGTGKAVVHYKNGSRSEIPIGMIAEVS